MVKVKRTTRRTCRISYKTTVTFDGQAVVAVAVPHIHSAAAAASGVVFKHGIRQGDMALTQIECTAALADALVIAGRNVGCVQGQVCI